MEILGFLKLFECFDTITEHPRSFPHKGLARRLDPNAIWGGVFNEDENEWLVISGKAEDPFGVHAGLKRVA